MPQETGQFSEGERSILPIEKGFPIEHVNKIAQRESRAKQYYRPIYTMHKWWARRLGCVFRTICLYALLDDPENVEVSQPGISGSLDSFNTGTSEIEGLIENVDPADPTSLWGLYSKEVNISEKRIYDPFMGGGTSLVEASRFGAEAVGIDLNPVAWFVTKKELEGGSTDVEELKKGFREVKDEVAEEVQEYYQTPCPNGEHAADGMYYLWVKELDCVDCGHSVPLFKDYRVAKGRYENDEKYNVLCPECGSIVLVDDWQKEVTCDSLLDAEGTSCDYTFIPKEGNMGRSKYACFKCGGQYGITDAIQEQKGYDLRLYAVEYYCPHCDEKGLPKSDVKGYKAAVDADVEKYEQIVEEWNANSELHEYVPDEQIPKGASTVVAEGVNYDGHDVFNHGYEKWTDMFSKRQLLSLSKILRSIDDLEDNHISEYLLLALSASLRYTNMMVGYHHTRNHIHDIFKTNSYDPPMKPTENNVWGTKFGLGTFESMFQNVLNGIEYANAPTERHFDNGNSVETPPFLTPVGENTTVTQGDMRRVKLEGEFDAVITDPPYYDNVLYAELSDFFYVWQKVLLEDEYECFTSNKTPRKESIEVNPFLDKSSEDFEAELYESFSIIKDRLVDDGVLAFTYHHSDAESWGELLAALCDVGFEVTATYPISADINKFTDGEAVEFDIVIVARPAGKRELVSWNKLRRNIYRTAQRTRKRLEENRDLSRGDIGVVEMGRCFHEYSKHHGKVERAGEPMTAKEVVDEIYGVIQHGSDIGEIDVFLDLLDTPNTSYDDLNKLCRGTNATPERMADMRLYRMDDGFTLGTWDDEKRIAYVQSRVDGEEELTDLDKAQFLRYRWEHGKSISEYLGKWEITDDLRELCEGLADATGDDTYRNILESRLSDF